MDNNFLAVLSKYLRLLACAAVGLMVWVAILVFIDDTGLWHFEFSGWLSDFMRLGIVLLAAAIATGIAVALNFFFKSFLKQSDDLD